jgi:aryl-alcohol dehydrogenase-like predicted oxidoreductase
MGLLVWSPLAGGFLSGKYRRDQQGENGDRHSQFSFPPVDKERSYAILDVLEEIAASHNTSISSIALAWLLHQPAVTSVIVGAKRPQQLAENLAASEISLHAHELARLDEVSRLPYEYLTWPFLQDDESITRKLPALN